jgi:hypothetical protein
LAIARQSLVPQTRIIEKRIVMRQSGWNRCRHGDGLIATRECYSEMRVLGFRYGRLINCVRSVPYISGINKRARKRVRTCRSCMHTHLIPVAGGGSPRKRAHTQPQSRKRQQNQSAFANHSATYNKMQTLLPSPLAPKENRSPKPCAP